MLTGVKKSVRATINSFLYGKDAFRNLTPEQKTVAIKTYQKAFTPSDPERTRAATEIFKKEIADIHSTSETSQTHNEWFQNLEQLRKEVLGASDVTNFTNWNVVKNTMFHECAPRELRELQHSSLWKQYEPVLVEDAVGNPPPYRYYPRSSGNRIHTLYNLHQLLSAFGVNPSSLKTVFEFGGGYGCMAQLLYTLGFEGSYYLYDIPEFSSLQKFYLSSLGTYPSKDVHFLSSTQSLPAVDLFIATWSLSESPVALREKIWSMVGNPNYILIAYQSMFESVDNADYFAEFMKDRPNYTWRTVEIPHLRGSSYLLGKKTHD